MQMAEQKLSMAQLELKCGFAVEKYSARELWNNFEQELTLC
jgi:hypothetical protein